MSSFANLKRNSGNLDKLTKAVEALKSNSGDDSDKYWKLELDKSSNGMAVIRFLPAPAVDGDEGLPWVKIYHHGFQGPGGWYIDNCPTTLNGQPCPVCESNSSFWNSGIEANKEIARGRKRKLSYIANIYIVNDPKHPENNGTVKLFKFGAKIFEKITSAMHPEFSDEEPMNPFDLWTGANFKLKSTKRDGYQNYDKSEFDKVAPLFDSDDEMEEVWKKEFSLQELVSEKNFKSYDQLKGRLNKVLGIGEVVGAKSAKQKVRAEEESIDEALEPKDTSGETSSADSDTDDDLAFFQELADES